MPMTQTSVTVVIPVYNAEATLARALESVYGQTLPALEVLCVDDGSQDASEDVARAFRHKTGPLLRWLSDGVHRGPGGARNLGIEAARGQLIAFLDSDDAWHPYKLSLQVQALHELGLDLIGGHSFVCKAPHWKPEPMASSLHIHPVGLRKAMLSNPFHTSSVLMRRHTALRFPDSGALAEDYALWLGLAAAGRRCARHDEPLSAMFKPVFGQAGLSSHLLQMQMGELVALTRIGLQADPSWLAVALPWSCAKALRRFVLANRGLRRTGALGRR